MSRYRETNLIPSIERWLEREGIAEDSLEPVFRDGNDRVIVFQMLSGQYLTFLRTHNTPVIGYLAPDLLPPLFQKRIKRVIGEHQQKLQDRAMELLKTQHGH